VFGHGAAERAARDWRAQALIEAAPAQPKSEFGERKSKEMKAKFLLFPFIFF
jgi:hypothetical protein